MCDERERMLGYLYDECAPEERRVIDAHLASCGTCRDELQSLRAVRNDLASWNVPIRDAMWTPFVSARALPWWQHVPTWAMAAAATLLLALGAGGGFAVRSVMAAKSATPAVTVDAAAIEQGVLDKVHAELASTMAARPASVVAPVQTSTESTHLTADDLKQIQQIIAQSDQRQDQRQLVRISGLLSEFQRTHQFELDQMRSTIDTQSGELQNLKLRNDLRAGRETVK